MQATFRGTGVALVTPFNKDESIDYTSLKKLVEHAISGNVDYLVVNGTTGESATTSEDEKNEILSFIIKENNGRKPIMYGIGANNTSAVLKKISKTDFKGIQGVLSVCPYYNKPSQEGIYQHYKKIAENCPVPVMLYNVPGRTGVNMSAGTTIRLSEVPNIMGIKEAHFDLTQPLEVLANVRKDFLVVSGDDLLTVQMMALGAQGAISVLANAFPARYSSVVSQALQGKFIEASRELAKFCEINPLMYSESNPVGIKYTMEQLGIMQGHVRLPLVAPSAELKDKISKALQKLK